MKGRVGREGWKGTTTPQRKKNLRPQDLYMFKFLCNISSVLTFFVFSETEEGIDNVEHVLPVFFKCV